MAWKNIPELDLFMLSGPLSLNPVDDEIKTVTYLAFICLCWSSSIAGTIEL